MIDEADVLYMYGLEQERPDAALLATYLRLYPEHADALVEFTTWWVLDTISHEEVSDP